MSDFYALTDVELWRRMQEGDEDAYAYIYQRHMSAMYNYALKLSFEPEAIEDAIHDLFVRIYAKRGQLTQIKNIQVYLFIALKNTLLNTVRKQQFVPFTNDLVVSIDHSVEDKIIENELATSQQRILRQVFCLLSKRQREVIFYRYYKSLSYKEIAGLLEINEQSAKT